MEESPEPKNVFSEPDISQVLPARKAAQKATSEIQRIAVEETSSSVPAAPNVASTGVQTERVGRPCAPTPIGTAPRGSSSSSAAGSITPGAAMVITPPRGAAVSSSLQPSKSLATGELESKVIPGRTNNQVLEMRKRILQHGFVSCIYEVRSTVVLFG